jgi:putative SOS response-associated peptidase YedK
MCGRYNIIPDVPAWLTAFGLPNVAGEAISKLSPNYNVAPSQSVPIVRWNQTTGGRELVLARWGLIPSWAKDDKIGYRMINARAETVAQKPAFRRAFLKRRCLIPANGFYEWKKGASGKQPYLIQLKDQSPFAFAGLWETWHNAQAGTNLESCTIIVTEANRFMASIHDRMPVILGPDDYERWLSPDRHDGVTLLGGCPEEWLDAYPIGTYVNSPKNNDVRCIERIAMEDGGRNFAGSGATGIFRSGQTTDPGLAGAGLEDHKNTP